MYYENLSEEQGEHNIFYVILRSLKKGFILKIDIKIIRGKKEIKDGKFHILCTDLFCFW